MKKSMSFAALIITLAIMISMMVIPASAAGPYTITINGTAEGHTYEAYQIFTGDLSTEGVLSNIEWGSGVNGATLLPLLKADNAFIKDGNNSFASASTAEAVAQVLSTWSPDSVHLDRFAELVGKSLATASGSSSASGTTYTISGLDAGYYLVKDTSVPDTNEGDMYTKYIIRVVRSVEVSPKGGVPTINKTVHTALDGTYKSYEDASVGDTVYFKLEGTLPSNYISDYAMYYYKFSDTLPTGLTFSNVEAVYILHANDTTTNVDASAFSAENAGQTVNVTFTDLKTSIPTLLASDKIVVKYSAKLNENAVIGSTGNVNSAKLFYSNDPNQDAGETPNTGVTSTTSATVYTFNMAVSKVDGINTSKKLAGAEFLLYRNFVSGSNTTKLYAQITNGVISGWTENSVDATKLVSSSDSATLGQFSVAGLDSGIYYLEETKSPSGYNKLDSAVRVTITANYASKVITTLTFDVDGVPGTGDIATGTVNVSIRNNAGATLPSTGGIGTTIFYVAGILLIAAAAAVVIIRKRSEAK